MDPLRLVNKLYCPKLMITVKGRRKEMFLFNDALNTFLCTVIWRQAYGKGPLQKREKKPAAATWATLSD